MNLLQINLNVIISINLNLRLIKDVITRWNSLYHIFLYENSDIENNDDDDFNAEN